MGNEKVKWHELREKVKNSYEFDDNWSKSIELFKSRIQNKFMDPIENIIKQRNLKGEGFAIVTVQCSLIESLAAFRVGKIFNFDKQKNGPAYEYRNSCDLYVDFLNSAEIFKDNFFSINKKGIKQKDFPFNAKDFYRNVRCGLVHEGKTKGNWAIKASKEKARTERIFIKSNGGAVNLYRSVLHYRLKDYLDSYGEDLARGENASLRRLFGRKLDNLFEVKRDKKYDWWDGE